MIRVDHKWTHWDKNLSKFVNQKIQFPAWVEPFPDPNITSEDEYWVAFLSYTIDNFSNALTFEMKKIGFI